MIKISVKNLNLYYGKFHALKDINMDINKNEMEISLENDDNSVALLANIPVNRIKNQAKR